MISKLKIGKRIKIAAMTNESSEYNISVLKQRLQFQQLTVIENIT